MKSMMKVTLIASTVKVAVVAMLLASPFAAQADLNIAVFDAQKVLDSIDEGKKAVTKLENEARDKEKAFEGKRKELETLKKEIDSQSLVLSKEALEKKKREFDQKYMAFQQEAMKVQEELKRKELEMTGEIFKKINAVIQKMGKEGQYDLILEKNQGAVTFVKQGEITQKVIDAYNKTYKK